jgi:nucleotide-binding universal stress UspA family protein
MACKLYKRILIATDGKDYTKNAIDYGIELAKNTQAKLYVIYVMAASSAELKKECEEATGYVADRAQVEGMVIGLEVGRDYIIGYPVEEIIKYAEKYSVDLIVMGTSRKSGLNRFLLGSVTEKVVRSSKIPVLVVPGNRKNI